jgi:hypothetical protein
LFRHREVDELVRRDQVVGVLGGLVDLDLHAVDLAIELVASWSSEVDDARPAITVNTAARGFPPPSGFVPAVNIHTS